MRRAALRHRLCLLPFCLQKLHLRDQERRCRLRPDQPPRGMRSAFDFAAGMLRSASFSPRATVLDWLREEMGAKGTKEGCAEGDCGACTVVLARLRDGRLAYEPFNACILLLGQLDGAELITIEDLAAGGELHPLQQAMVDAHASQCGFCTPGIVMSLFAAYHSGQPHDLRGALRPACRQSLPMHRLSPDHRGGPGDLQRRASRPFRRDVSRARRGARRSRRPQGRVRRRRSGLLRRSGEPRIRWRRSMRVFPTRPSSAGRRMLGSGSPSNCAT